jgi:stage III sporulation protein AH
MNKVKNELFTNADEIAHIPSDVETKEKPGNIFRKIKVHKLSKRGIIIACAVVLIGGAIYVNWLLFSNDSLTPTDVGDPNTYISSLDSEGSDGESNVGLLDDSSNNSIATDTESYFAISQINRQRARDESIEVLQNIVDNTDTLQELKEKATADINTIAINIENEANIETLIKAKGFINCIAVLSDNSANIVVESDGLMPNEVAQIKDIVYEQTGIAAANIKILEKTP